MSASKKTTSKTTASPAPASKSAASKSAAKTKSTAATVQVTAPTPVAMLAPSPAPAVSKTTAVTVAPKPVATTITAKIDVGYGNALFIRGEGPGLSWEKGVPMECVASDLWRVVLNESVRAFTFKFLINDNVWSAGPDFTAACGTSVTLTPEF